MRRTADLIVVPATDRLTAATAPQEPVREADEGMGAHGNGHPNSTPADVRTAVVTAERSAGVVAGNSESSGTGTWPMLSR